MQGLQMQDPTHPLLSAGTTVYHTPHGRDGYEEATASIHLLTPERMTLVMSQPSHAHQREGPISVFCWPTPETQGNSRPREFSRMHHPEDIHSGQQSFSS